MPRHGFIHSKEEIKYLALFALAQMPFPIDFNTVVDLTTWCDEGFGYFELSEAFYEMIPSGHIREELTNGVSMYVITEKGRAAVDVLEKGIPYPVREEARRSALRVVRQIRRNAGLHTSVQERAPNDLLVRLEMDGVFAIEMNVVSRAQATMLENHFKAHAEDIYRTLLPALIEEYPSARDSS